MKNFLLVFCLIFVFSCDEDGTTDPLIITDDDGTAVTDDDDGSNGNIGNASIIMTDFTPCENGMAGIYPCNAYDLIGNIPLNTFAASAANDIWGWTDTTTGKEYALIGLNNGTAFVDISDNDNFIYLGKLNTATFASVWRDIKVYNNHAFIVAEANNHGMQVFDLTKLRDVTNPPQNFTADARYTGIGSSHNLVINEAVGFAYPVGSDTFGGGVHFVDIQNPTSPTAAGGYASDGYSHDGQAVTYKGPDADHVGKEIYVGSNESIISIVDISDKANPQSIATLGYANTGYTHQGWFTEDHRYFILGDELDEINFGFNSRTLIFDFTDLDNPNYLSEYLGPTGAIDHNGYVKGNEFFLANYTAGVRVLDLSNINTGVLSETGFFDTFPANNITSFDGVWSVYPYFESGKIIVNDDSNGFFVIKKSN